MKNWLRVAPVLLATAATAATCYFIAANGQEASFTKPSVQQVTATQPVKDGAVAQDERKADELDNHPPHDYLWLLKYEDKANLRGCFLNLGRAESR